MQLIGEILGDCIYVDTHLPRFDALAYVVPHFDALTPWSFVVTRSCLRKALFIFFLIVGAALATAFL